MSHQVKEDTPDVLPDGSRLYCLPSVSHNQHRFIFFTTVQGNWIEYRVNFTHFVKRWITSEQSTLRAITADTMADVLKGRYNHKLRNVRIIDCRLEQLHIFSCLKREISHYLMTHTTIIIKHAKKQNYAQISQEKVHTIIQTEYFGHVFFRENH